MAYWAGKFLELIGLMVVLAALFAGLGLIDGEPSMGREMLLLGIGGILFTLGWMLERVKGQT
jgi:hypothetical protein